MLPSSDLVLIKKKIDGAFNSIVAEINKRQSFYFSSNGKYWQGLQTPQTIPSDEKTEVNDFSRKPTDQNYSWNDMGMELLSNDVVSVSCNVYENEKGHGYEIVGRVKIGEGMWKRVANVGNESEREYDWKKEIPEEVSEKAVEDGRS